MDSKIYDVLVVTTAKDLIRVKDNIKRLLFGLPARKIIFIGSEEVGQLVSSLVDDSKAGFINENDIISFDQVHEVMKRASGQDNLARAVTGWYYQQFLKMAYANYSENQYYMVWDGDTVPTKEFSMFTDDGEQPYFHLKYEYHEEYFITMGKLIPGMHKIIGKSFIAEHMIFEVSLMKKLIDKIEENKSVPGQIFFEKIINSIRPDKLLSNSFSEFETYGTFVALNAPEVYKLRDWHSLRYGGMYFKPDEISEEDFAWLAKDFDAVTFEKGDSYMEEYAFFFHNPEYREKLSARQILEAIQAEAVTGMNEVWDDGTQKENESLEQAYRIVIEQEKRKGNDIIICPYGREGKKFKQILNEIMDIREIAIADDNEFGQGIIRIDDIAKIDAKNRTVIVNTINSEETVKLMNRLRGLNKNLRVVSIYGSVEVYQPDKKAFIEKFRELTEVKVPVIDKNYVRIGDPRDGGYIMLDDFEQSTVAYSYGINDDVSWDKDIADKYNMTVHMYDHTIDGLPQDNPLFDFHKNGIAGKDSADGILYSLETCLRLNKDMDKDRLILKMDVEGAEWDVINNTSSDILNKFSQMAFEFHDIEKSDKEDEIIMALSKLSETHFPVWVHGNNHSPAIATDDVVLPIAFEILYLNKKDYKYKEDSVIFPWSLDAANTVVFEDFALGNWGKKIF